MGTEKIKVRNQFFSKYWDIQYVNVCHIDTERDNSLVYSMSESSYKVCDKCAVSEIQSVAGKKNIMCTASDSFDIL